MIRLCDIILSLLGLILLFPILTLVFLLVFFGSGSPLFFQKRVGLNLKIFLLVKFRTMKIETLSLGTHLINPSEITLIGSFLRKYKIDELPQLWNVLKGDMSIVGPRPCLLNQKTLINERRKRGIFKIKPGITGLAQISGVNMSKPKLLSEIDAKMINELNMLKYFYFILMTILSIFK